MIDTEQAPGECADDYHHMSAMLRTRSDHLLRQLSEIGPAPSAVRRLLLDHLDHVLAEQRRMEWIRQQQQGGF